MAESDVAAIKRLLDEATREAEGLKARLDAGEDVSEEEMTTIAKRVAEVVEEANAKVKQLVGPIDTALMREKMIEDMSPEEFEEWSVDNAALQEYRAQKKKEQPGG